MLRHLLTDLGPTFIKLGQVLSTRPDLIPPAYQSELAQLQDRAGAVPLALIRGSIEDELGHPVSQLYAEFSDVPLASASIGQVHSARLNDGAEVVVKVRRPAIAGLIDADMRILRTLAAIACHLPGPLTRIDIQGFVDEFARTTRTELDYLEEGRSAERVHCEVCALGVHVPEVRWDLTTRAVLTLERIDGAKVDDLDALEAFHADRKALASTLARSYLSMVFVDGFFQADPHPGNLFCEPTGRLAMVDFGMTGTVTRAMRDALVELLLGLVRGDRTRSARALEDLGVLPNGGNNEQFTSELGKITAETIDVPLRELRFAPLLAEIMRVGRRHRLRFPSELALLVKTVIMCEGLAARLDPDFSLASELLAFASTHFPGAA